MKIVAVNRFYRPDHSATSQLLSDLAEYLAGEGRRVVVIASRLGYEGGEPLARREHLDGVDVRRVWSTQFGRANLVGRAVDYASFYVSSFIEMLKVARRGDILIAKTDPPLLSVTAAAAARLKGVRLINWCQDLFPETAGALGMRWADGFPGRGLRALRNWSLRAAQLNAVLHETMAQRLIDQGLSSEHLRVLPNWADRNIAPVATADNALRRAWGLEGRFVIGYSGNLGRAHMPDKIAALVRATKDVEGLSWLFIGGGAGLKAVKEAADGAAHVHFKPYQPREALSESLSLPDMHLISHDPACEGYILPSKLYGVRAVDRPVLFLGDPDGAIARDAAAADAGVVLSVNAPETWKAQIEALLAAFHSGATRRPQPGWRSGWNADKAAAAWADAIASVAAAGGLKQARTVATDKAAEIPAQTPKGAARNAMTHRLFVENGVTPDAANSNLP